MKILIVDGMPSMYLDRYYSRNPLAPTLDYSEGWKLMMNQCVGLADFYSRHLRPLGWSGNEVLINDRILQQRWLLENGGGDEIRPSTNWRIFEIARHLGRAIASRGGEVGRKLYERYRQVIRNQIIGAVYSEPWVLNILMRQIRAHQPDVLLVHALHDLHEEFLLEARKYVKVIVGQHASELPRNLPRHGYDLMLSSLPNQVDYFTRHGLRAELLKLAFESTILDRIEGNPIRSHDVSFIGGYTKAHDAGWKVFEALAEQQPIQFWGYGINQLPSNSAIRKSYHGEAWGMEMYQILSRSKIALNRHIEVAGRYANNMRLYEGTGMGAMLLTDRKMNLSDIFQIGSEVEDYGSAQECLEKIQYYQNHPEKREAVAAAGQKKVLQEHTYAHRMKELDGILRKLLSGK